MENQIDLYKKVMEIAEDHARENAYDSPYIHSSNYDDVYRLVHYFGVGKIQFLHKSKGYNWVVKTPIHGMVVVNTEKEIKII